MKYHYSIDFHPFLKDEKIYIWQQEVGLSFRYLLGLIGPFINEEIAKKMISSLPLEDLKPSAYEMRREFADQSIQIDELKWLDKYFAIPMSKNK